MILYTSDGCVYEGMEQSTVQALLDARGNTATFIDLATHEAYMATHPPISYMPTYLDSRNAAYPSYGQMISALAAKEGGDSTAYDAIVASIAAIDAQYPVS